MRGCGEREIRKRDAKSLPAEGGAVEEVTAVERGADLTLLVHLDRRL